MKRALFAGAALVIGATFTQGAVTPALAGQKNIKPKISVQPKISVKPKTRIRVVRPKVRIKIHPQQLARDKPEEANTDPTVQQAQTAGQPALRGKLADQIFQAMLGEFLEAAEAAKEAAEAAEAARRAKDFDIAIGGLVTVDPKDDLTGDGGGNAGNNKGPIDMSPDEFADRFGASKTAREAEDAGLADRFGAPSSGSSAVGDWSKSTGIAPDYTKIPTGGLASSVTTRDEGDGTPGSATTTKTVNDNGTVSVTKSTVGGGAATHSIALFNSTGELRLTRRTRAFNTGYIYHITRDWVTGIAGRTDNYGSAFLEWPFDPATGINRTQTGEEAATSTLPMPSCGSAACNALRRGLGIRSLATAGTRTNPGPDGATPTTQAPSVSAIINQDDLVKTNVAGDAANSETNRTARELKDKGVRY